MNDKLMQATAYPAKALRRLMRSAWYPGEVAWDEAYPGPVPTVLETMSTLSSKARIAVVKQEVYQDLYCCPPGLSARETILSTIQRSGPVGLFTKFGADFHIVKIEPDPECNIWKQKCWDCGSKSTEVYLNLRNRTFPVGSKSPGPGQAQFSVPSESVDWSRYDIVIGYECPVPARITQKFPDVLWAYYIGEPCMRSYDRSRVAPLSGYDVFLSQHFRCLDPSYIRPPHLIDFPYFLQYYGCFPDAGIGEKTGAARTGVMLERYTSKVMPDAERAKLESCGPVSVTSGGTEDFLLNLQKSKYFVRLGGNVLWGNAMIEAIAAGCLVIGNPEEFKHRSMFTSATSVSNFEGLSACIERFESHPDEYRRELAIQRMRCDYLCFSRPIVELFSALGRKREKK
jgi:hypothetical protein